jgi:hypothetical protein
MLKRKKPLLLSNEEWESMLQDAASRLAERSSGETADVSSWVVYRLLDSPKPQNVTSDTWGKVLPKLVQSFLSRAEAATSSGHTYGSIEDIRKLLAVSKPMAMYEEPWIRLMDSVAKVYVATSIMTSIRASTTSSVFRRFAETKPPTVSENDWQYYVERLGSVYFAQIFSDLRLDSAPTDYLLMVDLSPLTTSDAASLRQFAYQKEMRSVANVTTPTGAEQFLSGGKPGFMSEHDYERLTDTANMTRQAVADKRQYTALLAQLKNLVAGSPLAGKAPEGVSVGEWANVMRLEEAVVTAEGENKRCAADLARQEAETSKLKGRVLKQLEVINAFLYDPGVLDRIEDYEELFAPGNLSNLRRLAALRASKTS